MKEANEEHKDEVSILQLQRLPSVLSLTATVLKMTIDRTKAKHHKPLISMIITYKKSTCQRVLYLLQSGLLGIIIVNEQKSAQNKGHWC